MSHIPENKNRSWFRGHTESWGGRSAGLLLLRLTLGGVFLAHGIQKLTSWGWTGGASFFAEAGIPFPGVAAPLVTLVETLGGAMLLLGFATRATAGVLAFVMLAAAITVHLPHGFFAPNGVELVLVLGVCLVVLVLGGGGPWAVNPSALLSGNERKALAPVVKHEREPAEHSQTNVAREMGIG